MLICVICRESQAHRTHRVVPTEEAAQAYKVKKNNKEKGAPIGAAQLSKDIKSTWSRCEKVKFEKPMAVSQDVSERVGVSSQRNVCLQEALKKFRETLPYQLNFLISKAEKEGKTSFTTGKHH
ncbi:unnamed protein product [Caretta caretta]